MRTKARNYHHYTLLVPDGFGEGAEQGLSEFCEPGRVYHSYA